MLQKIFQYLPTRRHNLKNIDEFIERIDISSGIKIKSFMRVKTSYPLGFFTKEVLGYDYVITLIARDNKGRKIKYETTINYQ